MVWTAAERGFSSELNMKHDRQIGIRVGLPAFFALEVEDVYKHSRSAHRALAFPDFLGFLIGLGLEAYRKGNASEPEQEEAPEVSGAGEDGRGFDGREGILQRN